MGQDAVRVPAAAPTHAKPTRRGVIHLDPVGIHAEPSSGTVLLAYPAAHFVAGAVVPQSPDPSYDDGVPVQGIEKLAHVHESKPSHGSTLIYLGLVKQRVRIGCEVFVYVRGGEAVDVVWY